MAIVTNQLYSESTRGPLPAIQPDQGPGSVVVRTLAAGTAGTLPVGTPLVVTLASGLLAKAVPGAALDATNDIFAIVYPSPIVLDGTNEILGTVMLKGSVDFALLESLRAAGSIAGTAQQLKDCCRRPSVNARGLFFDNLTKIGGNAGLS